MSDAIIRLEHVTKAFNRRAVLDDVSLDVAAGTAFCLLGRSGTGKSVTLRHIIGLMAPDAGRVLVKDRDVPGMTTHDLSAMRRSIGFLFQNAALFDSISVGENVAFPLRRHTDWRDGKIREVARSRLADVGLGEAYDTMPGDLSGGMRKRAGLARAMALDPEILLVDEPSAGLDPITSSEITALLIALKRRGTTLFIVTHDIPAARQMADELAVLDDGHVIERGTVAELDRSPHALVQRFMRSEGSG